MNVLILNGNDNPSKPDIDDVISEIAFDLTDKGASVTRILLRNATIHECAGCFACWVKTPGICVFDDDMKDILKEYVNADIVIFGTNIEHFMVSPAIKAVLDRRIPLSCAYLRMDDGKMAHHQRYSRKQKFILLIEKCPGMTEQDRDAIAYMVSRKDQKKFVGAFYISEMNSEVTDAFINN